jgi:hypothetical protein
MKPDALAQGHRRCYCGSIMATISKFAYFKDRLVETDTAQVSVASSAVLYGLSVYTVFPVSQTSQGRRPSAGRPLPSAGQFSPDHRHRQLREGVDLRPVRNRRGGAGPGQRRDRGRPGRTTVHVDALVPGTRSRGLSTCLSMFVYTAAPILPQDGARLKTSVWRRVPDYSILPGPRSTAHTSTPCWPNRMPGLGLRRQHLPGRPGPRLRSSARPTSSRSGTASWSLRAPPATSWRASTGARSWRSPRRWASGPRNGRWT